MLHRQGPAHGQQPADQAAHRPGVVRSWDTTVPFNSIDDAEYDDEDLTLEEQWLIILAPSTRSFPIEDLIPEWNELSDDFDDDDAGSTSDVST